VPIGHGQRWLLVGVSPPIGVRPVTQGLLFESELPGDRGDRTGQLDHHFRGLAFVFWCVGPAIRRHWISLFRMRNLSGFAIREIRGLSAGGLSCCWRSGGGTELGGWTRARGGGGRSRTSPAWPARGAGWGPTRCICCSTRSPAWSVPRRRQGSSLGSTPSRATDNSIIPTSPTPEHRPTSPKTPAGPSPITGTALLHVIRSKIYSLAWAWSIVLVSPLGWS